MLEEVKSSSLNPLVRVCRRNLLRPTLVVGMDVEAGRAVES